MPDVQPSSQPSQPSPQPRPSRELLTSVLDEMVGPSWRMPLDALRWVHDQLPASLTAPRSPERPLERALEASRADLAAGKQRRADLVPSPIRRGVDTAKAYAASLFELDPEVKAVGDVMHQSVERQLPRTGKPVIDAMVAPHRALPNAMIDQLTAGTTPGGAALNVDPSLAPMLAGTPYVPRAIGGIPARGELAKTIYQIGEHSHALHPDVIERFGHGYKYGLPMDPKADWSSVIHDPEMLQAFGGDRHAARFFADIIGATSPTTPVNKNMREAVGVLAHALDRPGEDLLLKHYGAINKKGNPYKQTYLHGDLLSAAQAKVNAINQLINGLPNESPKTGRFGAFARGVNNVMPIDTHILHGAGAESDKLVDAFPALRKYFMRTEGLTAKELAGPAGEELMYQRLQDAMIPGMQSLDPKRQFHPLFGDIWEGIRGGPREEGLKQMKYQGGPKDFLRTYDLLDMEAMVDPQRLKRAYTQNKKWVATPPPKRTYSR